MTLDWHKTVEFIHNDWKSNKTRLILESTNWLLNVIIALTFALTVPNVPLLVLYPMFFIALGISTYSAVSRGSFGLLVTSITIILIDCFGYYKVLIA